MSNPYPPSAPNSVAAIAHVEILVVYPGRAPAAAVAPSVFGRTGVILRSNNNGTGGGGGEGCTHFMPGEGVGGGVLSLCVAVVVWP